MKTRRSPWRLHAPRPLVEWRTAVSFLLDKLGIRKLVNTSNKRIPIRRPCQTRRASWRTFQSTHEPLPWKRRSQIEATTQRKNCAGHPVPHLDDVHDAQPNVTPMLQPEVKGLGLAHKETAARNTQCGTDRRQQIPHARAGDGQTTNAGIQEEEDDRRLMQRDQKAARLRPRRRQTAQHDPCSKDGRTAAQDTQHGANRRRQAHSCRRQAKGTDPRADAGPCRRQMDSSTGTSQAASHVGAGSRQYDDNAKNTNRSGPSGNQTVQHDLRVED